MSVLAKLFPNLPDGIPVRLTEGAWQEQIADIVTWAKTLELDELGLLCTWHARHPQTDTHRDARRGVEGALDLTWSRRLGRARGMATHPQWCATSEVQHWHADGPLAGALAARFAPASVDAETVEALEAPYRDARRLIGARRGAPGCAEFLGAMASTWDASAGDLLVAAAATGFLAA